MEAAGEVHAEDAGDGGEREEDGGEDVEAVAGAEGFSGEAVLDFGFADGAVLNHVANVFEEEVEVAFDVVGAVAGVDEDFFVFDGVAGGLEGGLHVARGADDGGEFAEEFVEGVGVFGFFGGGIEGGFAVGVGLEVGVEGGGAVWAAGEAPVAIGRAPEDGGFAGGVVSGGWFVEDDEEVVILVDDALAAGGFLAKARGDGLGKVPVWWDDHRFFGFR